jgi:acetyl esterase/lipase
MHGSDIEYVRRVVEETDYTVLDATYNLAPEHPYPAAIHDAEDVIKWVLARPQEFDVSRGSIPASSAGGTLALISSGELFLKSIFRHLIVIYPPTDFSKDPKDEGAPDTSGKPLPDWMASFFANCYLPAGIDGKQPTVCPAFSRLENVPDNVTITTCACDNLCMEGEAVAQRISDMPGKHCSQLRMEKCNHAWDKSTKRGTEQEEAKRVAYDLAIETLRR